MGYQVDHKRMRDKYNPIPTKREREFHLWLIDNFSCFCECGGPAECVHHPLQRHREQRWRRDHEFVVPMRSACHMALHLAGSEDAYAGQLDFPEGAAEYRFMGQQGGLL
ncbi:hypothetical protein HME9302_00943 [Alteripontixanthobacter maritimus]|uniref:Uncharacterized protein n=1 Tax=Alteripontixanthobacter maritimus TaxID=2161824 RepID=A0A369QBW9_9SPHN|nr:hypothetical protein [Alteripontixanthobacter maritimus]RDC59748.1 hypothetical protein HME9302_00943 [Alteripontixanthobacter maritimus]